MRVVSIILLFGILSSGAAMAGQPGPRSDTVPYFFLPSRNFYFNNPQLLYLRGRSFNAPLHCRRPFYGAFHPYQGIGFLARNRGSYRILLDSAQLTDIVRANASDIIFRVDPPQALVRIDGLTIGSARDFSTRRSSYTLLDGEHDVQIEFPGYRTFRTRMNIIPNQTIHLDVELESAPLG